MDHRDTVLEAEFNMTDTAHDDLEGTIEDPEFFDDDFGFEDPSEVVPDSPYNHDLSHPTQAARFDQGKPRMELVDLNILEAIAKVAAFGAKKYSDNNWRKGFPWLQPYASMMRHLKKWHDGEDIDPESGLFHLDHAAWNIHALIAFRERGTGQDNRYIEPALLEPPPVVVTAYEELPGETFEVSVQIPADGTVEGFRWFEQGSARPTLDQALAVAQALRQDGYAQRVVRIRRIVKGRESLSDGSSRETRHFQLARMIFPGDNLPAVG